MVEDVDAGAEVLECPGQAGGPAAQPGQVAAAGIQGVGGQDPAGLFQQFHCPPGLSGGDRRGGGQPGDGGQPAQAVLPVGAGQGAGGGLREQRRRCLHRCQRLPRGQAGLAGQPGHALVGADPHRRWGGCVAGRLGEAAPGFVQRGRIPVLLGQGLQDIPRLARYPARLGWPGGTRRGVPQTVTASRSGAAFPVSSDRVSRAMPRLASRPAR